MKLRQQISSTAINITIVEIAEMIYLTRHLLTKTKVHQQVNSVKKAVVKHSAGMDSYELGNFIDINSSGIIECPFVIRWTGPDYIRRLRTCDLIPASSSRIEKHPVQLKNM